MQIMLILIEIYHHNLAHLSSGKVEKYTCQFEKDPENNYLLFIRRWYSSKLHNVDTTGINA